MVSVVTVEAVSANGVGSGAAIAVRNLDGLLALALAAARLLDTGEVDVPVAIGVGGAFSVLAD
jgi:hypothetical protein